MSGKLRESLSALLDGEVSQFEVRQVLREVRRDPQLQEAWQRFSRVSAAMRGDSVKVSNDLADSVWASLQDAAEPTSNLAQDASLSLMPHPNRRRLMAMAVAASAVLAVIMAMNWVGVGGDGEADAPIVAEAPVLERPLPVVAAAPERQSPNLQRLNSYRIRHLQHKAVSHPDVAAFTKLVTYETDSEGR